MGANPVDGAGLPFGVAFGRVDAQRIGAGLDEGGDTLGVVAGVDACTDEVALVAVEQLMGIGLVLLVVLAENQIKKVALVVDDGKGVELVVPDDVVRFLEARVGRGDDELLTRGHELRNGRIEAHTGKAIVAARDDAEQLALRLAALGDGHGSMTALLLQSDDVGEGRIGGKVGIAAHEARLVILDASDHGRLVLDGLGAVDEGQASLLSKGDGHAVIGNGLHDGGNHRDGQLQGRLFTTLETNQGRGEVHGLRNALRGGVTRNEKVLVEGTRGFVEVVCHVALLALLLIIRDPCTRWARQRDSCEIPLIIVTS